MENEKAAIYHFTDGSQKRPGIYQKELERLKAFASNKGFSEPDIFVDKSLCKCEQKILKELMENISSYKALILKDFYHLRKNTGICISELVSLNKKGIEIHTKEDGDFHFMEAPFGRALKVAVYYCGLGITEHSQKLQFDIMRLFVETKTKWMITEYYADLSGNKVDEKQKELWNLIKDRETYDVVLVRSFGDIHWRTSKFCKMRHLLKKGIYSMHDDIYLSYHMEGGYVV